MSGRRESSRRERQGGPIAWKGGDVESTVEGRLLWSGIIELLLDYEDRMRRVGNRRANDTRWYGIP